MINYIIVSRRMPNTMATLRHSQSRSRISTQCIMHLIRPTDALYITGLRVFPRPAARRGYGCYRSWPLGQFVRSERALWPPFYFPLSLTISKDVTHLQPSLGQVCVMLSPPEVLLYAKYSRVIRHCHEEFVAIFSRIIIQLTLTVPSLVSPFKFSYSCLW